MKFSKNCEGTRNASPKFFWAAIFLVDRDEAFGRTRNTLLAFWTNASISTEVAMLAGLGLEFSSRNTFRRFLHLLPRCQELTFRPMSTHGKVVLEIVKD